MNRQANNEIVVLNADDRFDLMLIMVRPSFRIGR
jgi:hypothetical protein